MSETFFGVLKSTSEDFVTTIENGNSIKIMPRFQAEQKNLDILQIPIHSEGLKAALKSSNKISEYDNQTGIWSILQN